MAPDDRKEPHDGQIRADALSVGMAVFCRIGEQSLLEALPISVDGADVNFEHTLT